MSSAAFSIVFSLDGEQFPKPSSDSLLPNPAIMSTPMMENGLRARLKSQPHDNCPRSNRKSISTPAFSSDALDPDNSPPKSETSAIPPIQPNLQDQAQYALGAGLEKGEELETIPHIQQVEDSGFCVTLL